MSYLYHKKGPMRVLVLLCLLSLSLLLTGACGAFLVWRSYAAYKGVVQKELPMLAALRDVSKQGTLSRRALSGFAGAQNETQRQGKVDDFEATVRNNDRNMMVFKELMNGKDEGDLYTQLEKSRSNYIKAARDFIKSFNRLDKIEIRERRDELESLYGNYIDDKDDLADYTEALVSTKSLQIIEKGKALYYFFLIVALWPIFISLVFFSYAILTTGFALFRARK